MINLTDILKYDYKRYKKGKPPKFQIYFRKIKESKGIKNLSIGVFLHIKKEKI